MQTLRGIGASPGVAVGPWVRVEAGRLPPGRVILPEELEAELARLEGALRVASDELAAIAEQLDADGHPDEGAIFTAQAAMARDPALRALAESRIRESREDAVRAVLAAGRAFAEQLRSLDDELLAARAADVLDVAARAARRAAGVPDPAPPVLDVPSLIVADDLAPSVTATLPRGRLLGFVLEAGSATAHAAILARAYGLPAVVGVQGLLAGLESATGANLALDGESGEVFVDPDAATSDLIEERRARSVAASRAALGEAGLPAVTVDGVEVTLLANIGGPGEAAHAVELGARGVGLFRTEFLFLERLSPPSEDEQVEVYGSVVEAFAPHPVTIRLLDIGGDKSIPYLPIAPEPNPFLGVRALRLAATRPALFVTQLRAALRAGLAGPVKVMAPMIADAGDAELLLELAARASAELDGEGVPHGEVALGVMLEIPSAVLVGDSYFGRLRFASLGTNDLLQYTLAVDRTNPGLGRYQDSLHPALLRLVREAVERADAAGIELSVCGEMAGDPAAALALVGLGIRQLSMAASGMPGVRRAIRASAAGRLRVEADAALREPSATAVRARFAALVAAG